MKISLSLILNLLFAINFYGINNITEEHPEKYCAHMMEGKIVVMHQEKEMKEEASLEDGSKIKADGTITRKDGTTVKLKSGECIDKNGKIMKEKTDARPKEKALNQ